MVSVTIPKNITKGEELVVIPKKLYERFLRVLGKAEVTISEPEEITHLSPSAKRFYKKAVYDIKHGRNITKTENIEDLFKLLKE